MTQLFDRKPDGDSEWTARASYIFQGFSDVVRDFLCKAEEDKSVDLRDLQTILKSAIDEVIHHELVCRRVRPDADYQDGPIQDGIESAFPSSPWVPEVVEEANEQSDEWLARDSYRTTEKKRVWLHNKWQDL